ncbi:MAG: hypothetical protein GXY85_11960 [Candidatus Brocadiaceae bacterium]|nr:hypothetical protein [Candidatus Brocadiaceae bacterium]
MKLVWAGVLALVCVGCMQTHHKVVFTAEGEAVKTKQDDPLAEAEARVAASVIAKANLLEKVKGGMVTGTASVGDLMFRSQEAEVRVSGFLSRADVTFQKKQDTQLSPSPIVRATATLELTCEEYARLRDFVE